MWRTNRDLTSEVRCVFLQTFSFQGHETLVLITYEIHFLHISGKRHLSDSRPLGLLWICSSTIRKEQVEDTTDQKEV